MSLRRLFCSQTKKKQFSANSERNRKFEEENGITHKTTLRELRDKNNRTTANSNSY